MKPDTHPVQMFLNIRLPAARPKRPFFADPRTRFQDWGLRHRRILHGGRVAAGTTTTETASGSRNR